MLPSDRSTHSRSGHLRMLLLLTIAVLLWAGCDTSVDTVISSNEHIYSLFGVLDVAADTQFIRVELLADSTQVGAPAEIDATVTLEHLGTEHTIALRDSFMEVSPGVFVHNFWTAEPIEPGATYRLRAERSDGAASEASTTLPDNPPEIHPCETFRFPCCYTGNNILTINLLEVDRIASMQVLYPIGDIIHTVHHIDEVSDQESYFDVQVDYEEDLSPLTNVVSPGAICPPRLDRPYAWVTASAAGPDFPDLRGIDLDVFARPDSFSNVENGHGFVGGVYSDTVRVPVRMVTCE